MVILRMGLKMLAQNEFLLVKGSPLKDSKMKTVPQECSAEKHLGMDKEKDTFIRTNVHCGGT